MTGGTTATVVTTGTRPRYKVVVTGGTTGTVVMIGTVRATKRDRSNDRDGRVSGPAATAETSGTVVMMATVRATRPW